MRLQWDVHPPKFLTRALPYEHEDRTILGKSSTPILERTTAVRFLPRCGRMNPCSLRRENLDLSLYPFTSSTLAALATPDCSRLLVCFLDMHTFWQPGFTPLHELVIDGLTDVHLVGALPLLGVNQHLRQLVIKRLVAAYSKAAEVAARSIRRLVPFADDGEFVSVSPRRYVLHSKSNVCCVVKDSGLLTDASAEPCFQMWLNWVAPLPGPHMEDDPRYTLAQAGERDSWAADPIDFVL